MAGLNVLERDNLLRQISQMKEDIKRMKAFLNGSPISNARILSLSWDKAQGGTATLGGAANGDGILQIRDAADALISQSDKDGTHFYDSSSDELVRLSEEGMDLYGINGSTVKMWSNGPGTDLIGTFGYSSSGSGVTIRSYDRSISMFSDAILNLNAETNAIIRSTNLASELSLSSSGIVDLTCTTFNINGSPKTAVVPTSKGFRALYCSEAPEVWFFDFAKVIRPKWYEFWKKPSYQVSSLFGETVESISHIMPTENKNIVQVWGIRKGFKNVRFEEKTKEEFEKNNQFWDTPKVKKVK